MQLKLVYRKKTNYFHMDKGKITICGSICIPENGLPAKY